MATATAEKLVEATPRAAESRGKNEARRLRVQGKIPAVLYGAKKDSIAVSVDPKQIGRILHTGAGHNTIFDLKVGSEQTKAMIVDWQYEPIKGSLMHIDMKRIAMDVLLRVKVPIHLVGTAEGVKTAGRIDGPGAARSGSRVLADRHPEPHRYRRDRDGVRRREARERPAAWRQAEVRHRRRADRGPRDRCEGRSGCDSGSSRGDATAAPAEPEVIKKGKQETEEGAAAAPAAEAKAEKKEKK